MEYPVSLYFHIEVTDIQTIDLCRVDDDYRKVYIVNDGSRKAAMSVNVTDKRKPPIRQRPIQVRLFSDENSLT
ncbi:MAG: hypothetical protein LUI15_01340 [Firmicutes bacterium]|nr:hypothetical protein [Bacillota bacterium]